jgi:hypothetical protein
VVIGAAFAWAHLPKTAGDTTHAMLTAVPGLATFADPPDSNDKHLPFFAREAEVSGKLLVMNIRRLPAWTLSAAHHRATHGIHPEYRPLPLQSADEMCESTDADDLLRWMTDHGRFAVQRWLRTEQILDDALALLNELGMLDRRARRLVTAVGRLNVGAYQRGPQAFTAEQIARMYARNTGWAEIERRVYGEIAT